MKKMTVDEFCNQPQGSFKKFIQKQENEMNKNLWINDIHGNGQSWSFYIDGGLDEAITTVMEIRGQNQLNSLHGLYKDDEGVFHEI